MIDWSSTMRKLHLTKETVQKRALRAVMSSRQVYHSLAAEESSREAYDSYTSDMSPEDEMVIVADDKNKSWRWKVPRRTY